MPSLNDASVETKQIIKAIILFIASILIIFMIIKVSLAIKDTYFASTPEKPAMAFGKLPQQAFPQNTTNKKLNYSVNTITGELPTFKRQVKIYRIKRNTPDLLAVNKINDKIINIGFDRGYTSITDRVFQWTSRPRTYKINMVLTANILTNDFAITSEYLTDPAVLSAEKLRDTEDAVAYSRSILDTMQLSTSDLDLKNIKTNLYSITDNSLKPASSFSQAHVIEVYFVQKQIDNLNIVYDNPKSSNISFFVAGGRTNQQIVSAKYIHHKTDDEFSTYAIKTVTQAFEELKNGNGFIASYNSESTQVAINDVKLSYYMSTETQDFLMPVYVFMGNNDFVAYVSAVTDESISK